MREGRRLFEDSGLCSRMHGMNSLPRRRSADKEEWRVYLARGRAPLFMQRTNLFREVS